ncbi:MAG: universal stress protein [Hyphomicrobiales bacterium]|nr:universal stress protein [Hyphomicrobiales bacterium]
MFKNILAPIDVTHAESSELALNAARKLADSSGAKLTLLNIVGDVPNLVAVQLPKDYAEKAEAAAKDQLGSVAKSCGLAEGAYEVIVGSGPAYHEILAQAKKMGADLIVMASHRPELADYLLGTVAARVVRHAKCSVLVVRE